MSLIYLLPLKHFNGVKHICSTLNQFSSYVLRQNSVTCLKFCSYITFRHNAEVLNESKRPRLAGGLKKTLRCVIYKENRVFNPSAPLSTATVNRRQQKGAHCGSRMDSLHSHFSHKKSLTSSLAEPKYVTNMSGGFLPYSALQNWFRLVPVERHNQGLTMK